MHSSCLADGERLGTICKVPGKEYTRSAPGIMGNLVVVSAGTFNV